MFAGDHHGATPNHRLSGGDLLDYAQFDVLIEICLDFLFPMKRNRDGNMRCIWFGVFFEVYVDRFALHFLKRCGLFKYGGEAVYQVLF